MLPEVKNLSLRVHTKHKTDFQLFQADNDLWDGALQKWPRHLLILDCETTTQELGQKFNFGFYRKCKLTKRGYVTLEEGIIVANDLHKREGKQAVDLLRKFRRENKPDTISGRFAQMRLYSQSDFITKVMFPYAVLKKASVAGANVPFDLSVLSTEYHEHKTENGFSVEVAPRFRKRENKR